MMIHYIYKAELTLEPESNKLQFSITPRVPSDMLSDDAYKPLLEHFHDKYRERLLPHNQYVEKHLKDFGISWENIIIPNFSIEPTQYCLPKDLLEHILEPLNLNPVRETIRSVKLADERGKSQRLFWGEAPDIGIFVGREEELNTLRQWIINDRCRVVAIVGMAGVGKTKLAITLCKGGISKTNISEILAKDIQNDFEFIIWEKLLNAQPLIDILKFIIKIISDQREINLPHDENKLISRLINYFKKYRCLLVLDNMEAVLQGGEHSEKYKPGYEGYGTLLSKLGEVYHKSCLLLTSREKPKEIMRLGGNNKTVRSLEMSGLDVKEGRELLESTNLLSGADNDWKELVNRYNGNPLALELAAKHIREVFSGKISTFLREGNTLFKDINDLLDWHFSRLTEMEKEIIYWLAINREMVSLTELREDILLISSKEKLTSTLQSLQHKIPLERSSSNYTLQPVLMQFFTEHLIENIIEEIGPGKLIFTKYKRNQVVKKFDVYNLSLFDNYALIKALSKDYVRDSQIRLIIRPIIDKLIELFDDKTDFHLSQILSCLKEFPQSIKGYAGGNILNLLRQLKFNLNNIDLSYLPIRQAYLQDVCLHDVNLSYCYIDRSLFTQTFGSILSMTFNPNGTLLATGDANGEIRFWRTSDMQLILTCSGHTNWIRALDFSPNGEMLASGSEDKTIKIWDVENGNCISSLDGHSNRVRSIKFSPDGRLLFTGSEDRKIKVWNINIDKDKCKCKCINTLTGHKDRIRSITLNHNGSFLASGGDDTTVRIWRLPDGKNIINLQGHSDRVRSVTFSPHGKILASGSDDKTIKIWDMSKGECLKTLEGHTNRIRSVEFDSSGNLLISGSEDQTIKIWNVNNWKCLNTLEGHTGRVWVVATNPRRPIIASGGDDQTIRLWNKKGKCIRILNGFTNYFWSIAFNHNGQLLASGSADKLVRIWNVESGECIKSMKGHENWVRSVAFNRNGQFLASGSEDQTVRIWNVSTGKCLNIFKEHTNRVMTIAFSPIADIVCSGSEDHTLKLWDINKGECFNTLKGHKKRIRSLDFSFDGKFLISGSEDQTVRLWDPYTGKLLKIFNEHDDRVIAVKFISEDYIFATITRLSTVQYWNAVTYHRMEIVNYNTEWPRVATYSPNNNIIATDSNRLNVDLWDANTRKCLQNIQGHKRRIMSIVFSPDGNIIASCGFDETIRLMDTKTIKCFNVLRVKRPYEGMNITGIKGLTPVQQYALKTLGAITR